jgi:hypothetical protein
MIFEESEQLKPTEEIHHEDRPEDGHVEDLEESQRKGDQRRMHRFEPEKRGDV